MRGFLPNFSDSTTGSSLYASTAMDETGSFRSGLIHHRLPSDHNFKEQGVESTRLLLLVRDMSEMMWTGFVRKICTTFLRFAVEEFRSARREKCFGITLQFDWD
ncbi:MAG TPA: hypothetical protein VNO32_14390 [Candidatus Acidoferrum sp.]|nr:hypothetical protein [Candidatus Acidoferrum sp.]